MENQGLSRDELRERPFFFDAPARGPAMASDFDQGPLKRWVFMKFSLGL